MHPAQKFSVTELMKPTVPCRPRQAVRPRRVGGVGDGSGVSAPKRGGQALPRLGRRDQALLGHVEDAVERHDLDVAHLPGVVERQRGEVGDLVVVEAAHHHRVQLDRRQAVLLGGADAVEDLADVAAAGDAAEAVGVEGVDADVEAVEPGGGERRGELRQEEGVGRHRDLLHPRERLDGAHELRQVGAHGRLAAGEAELAEAQLRPPGR